MFVVFYVVSFLHSSYENEVRKHRFVILLQTLALSFPHPICDRRGRRAQTFFDVVSFSHTHYFSAWDGNCMAAMDTRMEEAEAVAVMVIRRI